MFFRSRRILSQYVYFFLLNTPVREKSKLFTWQLVQRIISVHFTLQARESGIDRVINTRIVCYTVNLVCWNKLLYITVNLF